jgi:hypothetical protein
MKHANTLLWNYRACGIPASFVSAETTSMTYSNMTAERKALIDFYV